MAVTEVPQVLCTEDKQVVGTKLFKAQFADVDVLNEVVEKGFSAGKHRTSMDFCIQAGN